MGIRTSVWIKYNANNFFNRQKLSAVSVPVKSFATLLAQLGVKCFFTSLGLTIAL
jgi:hypothetical protein